MSTTKLAPADSRADATAAANHLRVAAGLNVLVVDDDDLVRSGASRSLVRLGYRTVSASGPEEALRLLRADPQHFNLLFTDIRMPGPMDGFDLARIVRQEFPRIAILLTTGFAGRSREPGMRILYKPYKLTELADAVGETLVAHPPSA